MVTRENKPWTHHVLWIMREWRQHKLYVLLLVFLTMLSAGVAVVYPFLFKLIIDSIQSSLESPVEDNPMTPIYRIVWIIVSVGLVKIITSFYPGFRAYMNLLFEFILRQRFFKKILEKDYRFFMKFRTGDLVTRLTSDIQDFPKIGWFMCSGIFRAFDSFIKILFCLIAMYLICSKLTIIALIPIPLMVIVFFIVSERLHRSFKKNQEAISEINNQLEMTFSGIKIIKSFVCEHKYKRFFDKALHNRFTTELRLIKIGTILHLVYEYIDYFAMITIILFGGYMVVKGEITVGTFYAFYTYLGMLIYPILDLPQLFISGRQAFVCIDRLDEIGDFPVISYSDEKNISISEIESIRFENVSFGYETEAQNRDEFATTHRTILDNISFSIKKGQKVLIIGSSGAGKSTILGLLSGRLIPQSGTIYVNDMPIKDINVTSLRNLIGYVPQEPSLFTGTIKDNVLFGTDGVSLTGSDHDERYDTIINVVQMADEIASFSDGDMTMLGQKGLSLSGGQKQRVAIARALYKQPQLLILDDITASLDAKKEDLLWNMISPIFHDLTAFIVSHRLSSLRYAELVLYIEAGKVSAFGDHEELLRTNADYGDFIRHHYKSK